MRIQRSSITCHEANGVYLYPTSHSSPGKAYTYDGEIKVHCFPSIKNKGGCKTLIKYGLGAVHSGVWYEAVLSSSSPVLVCSITVLAGGGNHTIAAVGWSEIDHTLKWYALSVFTATHGDDGGGGGGGGGGGAAGSVFVTSRVSRWYQYAPALADAGTTTHGDAGGGGGGGTASTGEGGGGMAMALRSAGAAGGHLLSELRDHLLKGVRAKLLRLLRGLLRGLRFCA